jgi:hypothetical protein
MVNRVASAVLWFIAVGWAFNYLAAYLNFSPMVGVLVAGASSAFVAFDPVRVLWPTKRETQPPSVSSPASGRYQPARAPEAI